MTEISLSESEWKHILAMVGAAFMILPESNSPGYISLKQDLEKTWDIIRIKVNDNRGKDNDDK